MYIYKGIYDRQDCNHIRIIINTYKINLQNVQLAYKINNYGVNTR